MADLKTRSRLDDSDFNRGLARMRKQARDFNKQLGKEFTRVFSGAALGAGLVSGIYAAGRAITSAFGHADKLSDLAETLREMPSDLVRVGGAASLMGSDMESVIKAAVKLRVNLGKAAEGDKEMTETMKIMGLNARELSQMPLPEMMVALARGYQKAEQSGRGYLVLQTLLGRSGTELANLLQQTPEALIEIFESIKSASDGAIMGMGAMAQEWQLRLMNMKQAFIEFTWEAISRWRKFSATIEREAESRQRTKWRMNTDKDLSGLQGGEREARANEILEEEKKQWMGRNPEKAGFIEKGSGYVPQKKGGVPAGTGEGAGSEKEVKETEKLIDAYERAKAAREDASRTEGQRIEANLARLGEIGAALKDQNISVEDTIKLRTEEQEVLKKIEDGERRIADAEKRAFEDAVRANEEKQKEAERAAKEAADEAAKRRELALEAAIESLKEKGRHTAEAEARLRVEAAQKEYALAKGSKDEAEKYVALMVARNNLTEATGASQGKSKNERIEEYIGQGMTSGEAKKKVRREDRDARKTAARINSFRRGAEEGPRHGIDEGVRDYMDSHRNEAGATAFDSGAWESGSHGQAVADAAAGKGIEGASGGDANGMGELLQAVQELKQAIEKATGGE